MQDLRLSKHYYGEFLSQGELRIEGHCSIVSIEDIINVGLMRLRPEFEGFETRKPAWANEVVRLRQNDTDISGLLPIDDDHVRIAMHIGELFGKRWRLPVMISCLALKPWQNIESQVMKALQQSEFEGWYCLDDSCTETDSLTDFQTLITALEEINYLAKANLPEVMRGEKIMRMVYMNLRLDEAYRKLSHRDSSVTFTKTNAPEQKDGRRPPRRSYVTSFFSWKEKSSMMNHCQTTSSRPGKGSWNI